jgi:hypothetical protein
MFVDDEEINGVRYDLPVWGDAILSLGVFTNFPLIL